ncbi:MAG: serine--tRNA ligase [Nitrospira sp.]|nr:serine--tRNA ligase [Candidatus Manganitrophaceae bacterium]HIL34878.1 serine--tRNA ligase [Candidatus Manganitrophaceae bacterium]
MLALRDLREGLDFVRERIALRQIDISFDEWIGLDQRQRDLKRQIEGLKHKKNKASEQIAKYKRERTSIEPILKEMKQVSEEISGLETALKQTEGKINPFLLKLPNLPHASVPIGKNEADNPEVRRWGKPPSFSFQPLPHWEIGEQLNILDFERGAKITGARFALYKGWGARLERALINFMLDLHVNEHGYKEIIPPFIVNRESMTATGQLPKFEEDLYQLKDNDYFLIPTAEVPLTNIHRAETLTESQLPLSYVAYTPCFRREAGTYGNESRGLIRQHQFNKVELVTFSFPDESYDLLERLLSHAEEVLKRLGLHYRVVSLCTGDLGFASAKTYDIEVWLPSQGRYREISSCSNFEGFQARRARIRYRTREGKIAHLHTLNGSALAVGRTVVALLENYQQADGSVLIPECLRAYMGGLKAIEDS